MSVPVIQEGKSPRTNTKSWVCHKVYPRESGLFCIAMSRFSIWVQWDSSDIISGRGTAITSTQMLELGGPDWVCGGMHESFSTESAPGWGSDWPLESRRADTMHGCERGVQSDRGGGDSEAEWEGEATTVKGTEGASDTVREVVQDRSLCVGGEESEGRGLEFNSVSEIMNTVLLLGGWLTSSSSGSEYSCSDRGQNGSRTCRNTRGIILQTRHSMQRHTHIQHPSKATDLEQPGLRDCT